MSVPGAVQDELRRRARRVAEEELAPYAAGWDAEERFPDRSWRAMGENGLIGLCTPTEYGGGGHGVAEACVVLEELARGCVASAQLLQLNLNGPGRVIARLGSEEQRRRWLPRLADGSWMISIAMTEPQAGSDGLALASTLTPDGAGWRLDGTKCHITNGDHADAMVVFCRLAGTAGARGIAAVLVERGMPGLRCDAPEPKMGVRGIGEVVVHLDGVRITADRVLLWPDAGSKAGAGFLLRQFNPERCGIAAMCLGAAQAALEAAVAYARRREQFGLPIASFQGIRWKLVDMATELDAARLLLARAARSEVDGFPATRETAMAKLAANEAAIRICDTALQICGHQGYLRTHPVERMLRDVRGFAIAGGSTEVMRNLLATEVTGLAVDQRIA